MRKFLLNNTDWVYETCDEEEATKMLIKEVCGADTIEEYNKYCESVGVNSEINWTEI